MTHWSTIPDDIAVEATGKKDNLTPEERELMNQLNAKHKSNLQNSYKLRDYCVPLIESRLKSKETSLFRYIAAYRDKNIEILSSPYITKIMIFSQEDQDILFKVCGIEQKDLQDVMDTIEDLPINTNEMFKEKLGGKVVRQKNITPFRVLCFFIFRYYYLKKDMKHADEMLFYYACSQYPTIFSSQFRMGILRPAAMQYAIDNAENRFTMKKEGSLEKAITYPIKKAAYDKYVHFVEDAADWWVQYIIGQFKTREAGVIKSVREIYDKAYNSGNVSYNQDTLTNDEGEIIENETSAGRISILADRYTTKFFSTNIDGAKVKKLSSAMRVSNTELTLVLENMQQDNRVNELKEFYSALFTVYHNLTQDISESSLHSVQFLATARSIYKKGNSIDPNIKKIKAILHQWLERGSSVYRSSNNAGTINEFRSALYYYFIFIVMGK